MQTLEPTLDAANQAIDHARRFSGRVVTLIKHVPDDKLCWRPSATSKSPLQLVLHCAASNIFMKNVIEANDKVPATPEDFFREVAEAEAQPATREEAVAMLEQSTEDLCRAIASLDSAALDSTPASPLRSPAGTRLDP